MTVALTLVLATLGVLVTGISARRGWLPERLEAVWAEAISPWRRLRQHRRGRLDSFSLRVTRELTWWLDIPDVQHEGQLLVYRHPRSGQVRQYARGGLEAYRRGAEAFKAGTAGAIDPRTTGRMPPTIRKLPATHKERLALLNELRAAEPDVAPPASVTKTAKTRR